ncbi:MAG TPA: AVAST type 2 anti-phage system protein Avs2, partial [Thermoanaerobaculia bacterium]|nr:AVAST type 2 anti-phage system protein Avs2 [Thermoanaerobaculia bacterium]
TSYTVDVVPESLGEHLTRETHPGFAAHEYQATRTFFEWFGIKRPSIPLLNPEFQNPLFLKLFCKGIKDAGLTEMPKGLHGVTQMFDFLLDAVNQKLSGPDQLDFDPKKHLVHEALRSVAQQLASSASHFLTRNEAQATVDAHLPNRTYNNSLFARLLSEGLLTEERVWRPEGLREGIRFAYERLQDHQIASYLIDMHVAEDDIATALEPEQPLGARVREYTREWTFGLIEALSIQVPERFGVELADVMPDAADSSPIRRAFIRSLLWRRPQAIGEPAKKYLRAGLTQAEFDELLDVVLTVAANPDHPFNADYLHARLMRDPMPERDAWWSIYLTEQYGEHTAVDRLVEWAWSSEDKSHIDDESVRLTATALMWFLTTSHRPLRDRATKALVRLLTPRLPVLESLLTAFRDVDDPYVRERLYGIAYGCVLRSSDGNAIGGIAQHVFEDVFKDGTPTPHILLRDYARGVVERAAALGVDGGLDLGRVRPPYKSDWPENLPSAEELKKKYDERPEGSGDEGYAQSTIYFSVAGGGDFDRYVIGTNSHSFNWSAIRLDESVPPTKRERHDAFAESLTDEQREALERFETASHGAFFKLLTASYQQQPEEETETSNPEGADEPRPPRAFRRVSDEEREHIEQELEREIADTENAFRKMLGPEELERFETEALPYIEHSGKEEEHLFDLGIAQRFVLNRVFELGWTIERFGFFDRNLRHGSVGREANKPERIGKKYQWLAWHEFLARVADHFQYEDHMAREVRKYDGPWQDFDRDLDPSLLIAATASERSTSAAAWWSPLMPYGDWRSIGSDAAWVAESSDLPPVEPLIAAQRPDGREFLVLETYREWTEPAPPGVERYDIERREIWYMVKSYVVRREHADAFYQWGSQQNFYGRWMPESHEMTRVYFGELFWAPAFHYHSTRHTGRRAWVGGDEEDSRLPAPVLVSTDAYMCEHSTFDCSLDETVNIHLPAAELVEWMGLTWRGREGYFVDQHDAEVAFDPSVFEAGPGAVVVDRARLSAMLEKQGLAMIWTVLGEKRVLAPLGEHRTAPYIISGCYRLRDGQLEGAVRIVAEDAERAGPSN